MMIVKCKLCGEKFKVYEYRKGVVKYCSAKCRDLGAVKLVENICLYCRKKFKIIPSVAGKRKYCSKKCSDKAKEGVSFSLQHRQNLILHLRKFWGKANRCVDCGQYYYDKHICIGEIGCRKLAKKNFNKKTIELGRLTRIKKIKSGEIVYVVGENHHNWVGNNIKYCGLHKWVRERKPRVNLCELCGCKKKLDLANKTDIYNRDFENWFWLCRKCHIRFDKGGKNE